LRLWNKGCDGGKNDQTLELLRQLLPGEWKENSRGLRLRERLFLEWGERFQWPDANAQVQGERFFCYGLADQFGVLCDGTVVPCCLDSDGVIALGNLFTEDLGQILTSERARAMVEGFRCGRASEELCRRCGYAQRFVK
jgi:radical SAM protein with 4Fe4S-binding SPASM domain